MKHTKFFKASMFTVLLAMLLCLMLMLTMVACNGVEDTDDEVSTCRRHVDRNHDGKCDKCGAAVEKNNGTNDDSNPDPTPTPPPTEEEIKKSEELKEEIKNDVEDKKPEEVESKIEDKQNELDAAQKELEDLKNNPDASEEEIAAAEEKQQQLEEQVEAAKEEKSYWTVTSAIKELYEQKYGSDGSYIRNINNIYGAGSTDLGFECEIISTDANGLLKQSVAYFNMSYTGIDELETMSDLKGFIDNATFVKKFEICINQIPEDKTELVNSFLNNLIFNDNSRDYNIVYNSVEIDENNRIKKIYVVFEQINKATGGIFLKLRSYDFRKVNETMSEEELLEEINNKNTNLYIIGKGTMYGTKLQIDWRNATIEYKSQEESSETEAASFETTNEQGEVVGFGLMPYKTMF